MNLLLRGLCAATLTLPLLAAAAELPSRRFQLPIDPAAQALQLPVLNAEKALAEDALADKGAPLRYAIMHKAAVNVADRSKIAVGRWFAVDAGFDLWRARIDAPGAISIDLALKPFHLPEGAEVWLSDAAGRVLRGPYTAADNPKFGEFWTPYVPGDVAYLEVLVPKARRDELQLGIMSVQQAYRSIESGDSPFAKSGSCNVDVVCSEGNNHRDQINAVAHYSISSGLCTGQLMNNTAQNGRRLFSTANHCIATQADASSLVAYWKYENPTCRTPGSTASGTPIGTSGNSVAQTGGATLLATYAPADTTLLELNTAVPDAAEPYWLGWDRSTTVPTSAVGIHHPSGDEKRISFENHTLVVSDINPSPGNLPGEKHWKVNDWDLGTTEQGSSGSVLLNPQKRLVGVLSGGGAACGNNLSDYYGRLNVAWEGGGTPATRVRDWLDPGSTGASAIDGKSACARPSLSMATSPGTAFAGSPVALTTQVSGGTGPYTLAVDVDGDGVVDRTQSNVAGPQTLQLTYPARATVVITQTATDATGCSTVAQLTLPVTGPRLAAELDGSPTQFCGDGDSNIEPGEIWDVRATLTNTGERALADGLAVFTGGGVPGAASSGGVSDSYGYRALASHESADCDFQPIDMSAATTHAPLLGPHVSNAAATDEGYVPGLAVGGSGGFRFYGETISTLMMSTNGYLSTNVADGGDDYSPTCAPDTHQGVVDGRLQVLHADLVVQSGGSLRHQHFAACPRPSDAGSASQGCTVFEWRNMGLYQLGGSPNGAAVFQAVLYDQSYEIVYQYLTADPASGASAVLGLQSPDQGTRLDYACANTAAAPAGRALCLFHPTALPSSQSEAKVHVVSYAGPLGNLPAGANAGASVLAYVDPAAQCGSRAVVSFLGAVDDFSHAMAPTKLVDVALPAAGNCQVASQCAAQLTSIGAPTVAGGMYWNPNRSGNGQNIFNVGNIFSSAWFTGAADRSPTWFLMAGPWNPTYSQASATINRFERTGTSPFTVAATDVGRAQFTRGDDDSAYVATWYLDGTWGGEKLSRVYPQNDLPQPNHTGGWANASESGWGVVVDEHRVGGQPSTGMIAYLYDGQNQPRWTLAEQANTSATTAHSMYRVHCPSCARIDEVAVAAPAGSISYTWSTQTGGVLNATMSLPAPYGGTWNRTALPIQMITPPLSPSP
jgi:hypothetical protein